MNHMTCAVTYMSATGAPTGGIPKILKLSEILAVHLVDRQYLPVAVTGDNYCIFGRWFRGP